jgi:hypothetical protein
VVQLALLLLLLLLLHEKLLLWRVAWSALRALTRSLAACR